MDVTTNDWHPMSLLPYSWRDGERAQGNSIVVFFVTHIFPGDPKLSGGVGLSGLRSGSLCCSRSWPGVSGNFGVDVGVDVYVGLAVGSSGGVVVTVACEVGVDPDVSVVECTRGSVSVWTH